MEKCAGLLLAGLFAAATAFAEDAYKWIDADGVVHYSDVPVEGAERVDLSGFSRSTGVQLVRRAPTASGGGDSGEPADDQQAVRYSDISIVTPGAEETLWNIDGVLNVSLAVTPALQPGHQVRVYFDGNPRIVPGTSFQLEEVWRGVHNIQAEVIDDTGRLIIRSQPNRFYVQQNTVITR